tara:strand:- start:264 stop:728 length:465 start_codon:yes stop_codon:yes gene_type:complete
VPKHSEKKILYFTPKQLFDLVSDVDSYHEFLPWCLASRVTKREKNILEGDLIVGFKLYREKFSSKIILFEPDKINVDYIRGPFKHLNNTWEFKPVNEGQHTEIRFFIDFQFKSKLLERLIGTLFHDAVKRMIFAFEKRAEEIYSVSHEGKDSID